MRKFLSVIFGFFILAAAGIALWAARGPVGSEERVTGGVLYSQQEIAAQTAGGTQPNLDVSSDQSSPTTPLSTGAIGVQPDLAPGALNDLSAVDEFEAAAAPASANEFGAQSLTLTNDVVLSADVDTVVAPLAGIDAFSEGTGGPGGLSSGYQQRVVELEWPSQFRVGGSGAVRIKLKLLADGSIQPVAEIATNQVLGTPILLTDRFDTHIAEVRADLRAPDFDIESVNSPIQTLSRTNEPEWRWTLNANESGSSVIVLGLTIHWIPKPEYPGELETTATIWGQALQVEVNHVFGSFTVPQTTIAGGVLAVIGFIAEIPLLDMLLGAIWRMLFGRRPKKNERRR